MCVYVRNTSKYKSKKKRVKGTGRVAEKLDFFWQKKGNSLPATLPKQLKTW
jgi:hypothetical protein